MSPDFLPPFGVAIHIPRNLDEQLDRQPDGSARVLLYTANSSEPLKAVLVRITNLRDCSIYDDNARTNVVVRGEQHWLELPCGFLPSEPCRCYIKVEGLQSRMLVSGRNQR